MSMFDEPLMLWVYWPLFNTFTGYLGNSKKSVATGLKIKATVELKVNDINDSSANRSWQVRISK